MSQPSQDEPTNRSTSPTGPPQPPTNVTNIDDPSHPLFHHRRSVGDFTYGDVLGEGSYSTVLLARDKKTDKQYAIKKLDKAHIVKNDKVKYVMIERDALSRMNHPGIVKLYWTFKDNRSLYYVLDLAPNGELYTYIRRLAPFSLETARFYAAEIVLALEHIHSKGVVHRDIKPENILFDEHMHIKITDFGSAKILQDNQEETPSQSNARSFVGTAEYVSPELLRSDPTSKEADLWALGCVIFQMISGKSPFKAATDYLIFQKIKNLDYTFPEEFPPVARDLVEKLLVPEASQRLGAGNIDLLKQHPFFEGVPWDTLFESQAPPLKEQLAEELRKHPPAPEIEDDNDMDIWFGEENPFSDAAAPQSNPEPKMNMTDNYASEPGMPDNRRSHSTPYDGSYSPARASLDQSSVTRSSTSDRPRDDLNNPWTAALYPNESILRASRMIRRRGLLHKKRFLILTDKPRLLYFDENKESLDGSGGRFRCEIPWTSRLLPELKGKSVFCINTPEKSYTLEDPQGHAQDWVNTLNTMIVDSFGLAA